MMPPLIIRKQKYFLSYYLIWAPYILTYVLTNRFPLFKPVQFPLTELDKAIPFLPFMIPIYVSYLVYAFIVVARSRNDQQVTEIFYITHIQLFICLCFFILYPVTYPREGFYYANSITNLFNQFWIWFDAPNNCFPSVHTANCCLAIHYSQDKSKRWLYTMWGILIIVGTLTCKQHYLIDVLAGILVYWISITLAKIFNISK
jgi:membrane-associated phospholipid phosphatase